MEPGPVRIYADELSYNLHIMMRFELEKQLFDGGLSVDDLDDAWEHPVEGISGGTPCQTRRGLGTGYALACRNVRVLPVVYAGQPLQRPDCGHLRRQLPEFDQLLREGNFAPVRQWLADHWYRYGQIYTNDQLLRQMTGEDLQAGYLCDYLESKFSELYNL